MKTYYKITFSSPGTFFCEQSSREFDTLDFPAILAAAKEIKERYNSAPFGFTYKKLQLPDSLPTVEGFEVTVEPKTLESTSAMHYITGDLIFARDLPENDRGRSILKSNLEGNSDGIGIENRNSFLFTGMFEIGDVIIDWDGNIIRRGNDKDLMQIRRENKAMLNERYAKYEK